MVFNEYAARAVAFLLEAVAFWLYGGVVICGSNEGDDEVFDGSEELQYMSDISQLLEEKNVTYIVHLICPMLDLYWV